MELNQTYTHEFQYTQAQVNLYAELTGDTNPVHLDADFAATTVFKRPIIHGMFSVGVFTMILGTKFGEGNIYLKQNFEFLRPMYVDTVYHAKITVVEIVEKKKHARIETIIYDATTKKQTVRGEAWLQFP